MTPEEIARRLTPAQKRALLWLPAGGSPRSEAEYPDIRIRTSLYALQAKRIGPDVTARLANLRGWAKPIGAWNATPLGAAVRAVVEREGRDA